MSATTECCGRLSGRFGHGACVLCGTENPWSLNVSFEPDGDGGVRTCFKADCRLQGYDGLLHGGVSAALLDAAMTHCLFRRGVRAVTGDLRVRYPHPVPVGRTLGLRAWVTEARSPLYRLRAELSEGVKVLVWSQATFCEMGDSEAGGKPTRSDGGPQI